jgi:hypothetical protein
MGLGEIDARKPRLAKAAVCAKLILAILTESLLGRLACLRRVLAEPLRQRAPQRTGPLRRLSSAYGYPKATQLAFILAPCFLASFLIG